MNYWKSKRAEQLVTFRTGKLDSNAAEVDGQYPFFTCANETFRINNYAYDTECVLLAGNNAAGIFPLKYYKGRFNAYQRTYIIEPIDRQSLDTRYLFEAFKLHLKSFEQSATGATTKFLTMGILNNLWLPLPPLPIQKKIAAILSAYDELIENNNRRIALLEKMAEEIYREWFVRMRFPGHEKAKFHKGIPEGWEVKKLGEVAEITYGFPFDGKQFNNNGDGNRIVRIRNIQSGETGDFSPEKVEEKYRICNGDFLVGMDGEFHMNRWSGGDAFLVQRTCRIKAKNNLLEYYVGKTVEPQVKFFESILMGATVGHLGAKHLNEMTVVVPDHSLATGLQALNDFMKTVLRLKTQNTLLKQTREALLPRLMSGKLDVEKLDIAFPPGMQN